MTSQLTDVDAYTDKDLEPVLVRVPFSGCFLSIADRCSHSKPNTQYYCAVYIIRSMLLHKCHPIFRVLANEPLHQPGTVLD